MLRAFALWTLLLVNLAAAYAQAPPPLSDAGRQAMARLDENDLAGAIALLEPEHRAGRLGRVEQAMLGALYVEVGRAGEAAEVLGPLADREDADAAVLYNAGRASAAMGLSDAAEGYFERAALLLPDSPAGRELGLLWGAKGRTLDAYRLLEPWAYRHGDDHPARIAAAALALRLGRQAEAEKLIEGLPESDPKVRMLRGQTLLFQGKPEEALAELTPLLTDTPPEMRGDLLRLTTDVYVLLGRSQEALDLVPEGPGGDARLALTLATAHYRQGAVDQAVATLEPFAAELPERHRAGETLGAIGARLAFEYGRLLAAAGRNAEAVPYLETSTAIFDGNAAAWKTLGDALLGAGRREEALAAREKFLALSAEEEERRRAIADPVVRALLQAKSAAESGDAEQAVGILRRAMSDSPQDVRLRLTELALLLRLGRQDEALERADEMVAKFPEHPDARYQHAVVNRALERTEAAEADLRRVVELHPGHVAALNDLAVILMGRGEDEEARRFLEKVLEVRPEDRMARQSLDKLDKAGG
jgi:tetratricopeptide (TPR) repeat protein